MINFEKYIEEQFQPLDVIGTTNFSPIAREIWRNTWERGNPLALFKWYPKRKNLSTHTAVTFLGKDGQRWLLEMTNTKYVFRFVNIENGRMLLPQEWVALKDGEQSMYRKVKILSGLKLSKPEKYFADNERRAHVCCIRRYINIDQKSMAIGNEWLYKRYKEGVPYDYNDIIALWNFAEKLGINILGSQDIYVCSELPQKLFEYLGILEHSYIPMTPMQWQKSILMSEVKV